MTESDEKPARPALRIVRGEPTPEEIAAITVVLSALASASGGDPAPEQTVGGWADSALRLRRPIAVGPGAWRSSIWQ